MFRSNKKATICCAALAFFALWGGNALAQRSQAPQPQADAQAMPSLGEVGLVLDFANAQPEFQNAMKPQNTAQITRLLLSYGMPKNVQVFDAPSNNQVPGGPYSNCYLAPTNVYYPAPYSWPNNPRVILLTICINYAGGFSAFGWN